MEVGFFFALVGSTLGDFIFVSLILGGGAAYLTGQGVAREWGQPVNLIAWSLAIAFGTRFLHYALFDGLFIAPLGYLLDAALFWLVSNAAFRMTRAAKMVAQYPWLYERSGLFTWRQKT